MKYKLINTPGIVYNYLTYPLNYIRYNTGTARMFKGSVFEKFSVLLFLFSIQLKAKFQKDNNPIMIKIIGLNIWGFHYQTLLILFREVFIYGDYRFIPSKKNPVIIDCGANIGMATLYFKKYSPEASIICFEANPKTFTILEKNIHANNFENSVKLFNLALYNKETEISFYDNDTSGSLVASIIKERGGKNEIKVKTVLLSKILEEFDEVELIKIDTEGAEIFILEDLVTSGKLSIAKNYIIEFHLNSNNGISSLGAFLLPFEKEGYKYNLRTNYEILGDNQDVLIHLYR
jgi:FkbM family methyltransferase